MKHSIIRNILCGLTILLLLQPYHVNAAEYKTMLDSESASTTKVFPTEDYNIRIRLNKTKEQEEYTYFNRNTGETKTYEVNQGVITKKIVSRENFHPYNLLYKPNTSVVFPDLKNVYFSYVTLPDTVDYIYQLNTGKSSAINCAPTSIAMAYNWANNLTKNTGLTATWIRDSYPSFEDNNEEARVGYTIQQKAEIYRDLGMEIYESGSCTRSSDYIKWLNQGCLLNLSVNSADLEYNSDATSRIGKTYRSGGGHSILCTGYLYMVVENPDTGETREKLYFEIVDPAEGDKNAIRYYTEESLDKMLNKNYCRYIAIKKQK